jgi:transcriptional regulator with XRE-family HTH domain
MEKNIRIRVGKNIKRFRKKCNYTQERLSELAKIDYKYLQKIEGKNPPNIKVETIAKLAKVLKINPSNLLD